MLYFNQANKTAQNPVVAIHGSASSGKQWRPLIDAANGEQPFLAVDLPGYGPGGFAELENSADRVQGIVDLIQTVETPIDLVGHSFGGAIALAVAAKVPNLIQKIVLYDPLYMPTALTHHADFASLIKMKNHFCNTEPMQAMEAFVNYWAGNDIWAGMPASAQARLLPSYDVIKSDFDYFSNQHLSANLGRIKSEVTVITGAKSPEPIHKMASLLAKRLTRPTRINLAGLVHLAPTLNAEILSDVILTQLDTARTSRLSA